MKIKEVRLNARRADVYDIETPTHDYILSNGCVSHNTMEKFAKTVVKGGKQIFLSADTIVQTRKRQLDGDERGSGFEFIAKVMKGRFAREGAVIPYKVTFEGGIDFTSGLFDIAKAIGYITMPKNGWYCDVHGLSQPSDKNFRRTKTEEKAFWLPFLEDAGFVDKVNELYSTSTKAVFSEEVAEEIEEIPEEPVMPTNETFNDIEVG